MAGTYDIEDALGMAMGMLAYCWVYCYRAGLGNLHKMPHRRCRSFRACCSQASAAATRTATIPVGRSGTV